MNWTMILMGFALAVLLGAGMVSLLASVRPEWSERRRRLTSASVLPLITALATVCGILLIAGASHGHMQEMEDLAIAALGTLGAGFTLLAWVGGLVGATLASRRRR